MSAVVIAHLLFLQKIQLVVTHVCLAGEQGWDVAVAEVGWHVVI
ncbi:Uncharacterised protein [Segatella copri]|nr:Uncharacterised protein [Segatella copri]